MLAEDLQLSTPYMCKACKLSHRSLLTQRYIMSVWAISTQQLSWSQNAKGISIKCRHQSFWEGEKKIQLAQFKDQSLCLGVILLFKKSRFLPPPPPALLCSSCLHFPCLLTLFLSGSSQPGVSVLACRAHTLCLPLGNFSLVILLLKTQSLLQILATGKAGWGQQ